MCYCSVENRRSRERPSAVTLRIVDNTSYYYYIVTYFFFFFTEEERDIRAKSRSEIYKKKIIQKLKTFERNNYNNDRETTRTMPRRIRDPLRAREIRWLDYSASSCIEMYYIHQNAEEISRFSHGAKYHILHWYQILASITQPRYKTLTLRVTSLGQNTNKPIIIIIDGLGWLVGRFHCCLLL